MLAAPILKLGLPTLVVLNMADDLHSRGGEVDAAALARDLGAPVAMISAAKGEGVDKVFQFLEGSAVGSHDPNPWCNCPCCRMFRSAGNGRRRVGSKAGLPGPRAVDVDAPPGCCLSASGLGTVIFSIVVIAVFQSIFTGAKPLMERIERSIGTSGRIHWDLCCPKAFCDRW